MLPPDAQGEAARGCAGIGVEAQHEARLVGSAAIDVGLAAECSPKPAQERRDARFDNNTLRLGPHQCTVGKEVEIALRVLHEHFLCRVETSGVAAADRA